MSGINRKSPRQIQTHRAPVTDDEPPPVPLTSNKLLSRGTRLVLSTRWLNYLGRYLFQPLVSLITPGPHFSGFNRNDFPLLVSHFTGVERSLP